MPWKLEFSPDASEQLSQLRKFDQQRILKSVETSLTDQPLKDSRHRKPLRSNLVAMRELRVGKFRVYYDVDEGRNAVLIRAIGIKLGNRVFIGGEEVELR